jgi:thymidylate kinase
MFFSFEGADASGKSSIIGQVSELFRGRHVPVLVATEFSVSQTGLVLRTALEFDKFLRPSPFDRRNVRKRTEEVVADLRHSWQAVIQPALRSGTVVLKDRYVDTVYSCEGPMLEEVGYTKAQAMAILDGVTKDLGLPTRTFLIHAPEDQRLARFPRRMHREGDGDISSGDLAIFAARDRWLSERAMACPDRIIAVFNPDDELERAAEDVRDQIDACRGQLQE